MIEKNARSQNAEQFLNETFEQILTEKYLISCEIASQKIIFFDAIWQLIFKLPIQKSMRSFIRGCLP